MWYPRWHMHPIVLLYKKKEPVFPMSYRSCLWGHCLVTWIVQYVSYENFVKELTGPAQERWWPKRKKKPTAYLPSQSGKSKQSNGESHDLNARITRLHVKLDSYSMFLIVFLCFLTRKSQRFRFKNRCNTCVPPGDADDTIDCFHPWPRIDTATPRVLKPTAVGLTVVSVDCRFLNALRTSRISCTDHASATGLV